MDIKKLLFSLSVPAILWFFLFNRWGIGPEIEFWPLMALSSGILLALSFFEDPSWFKGLKWGWKQWCAGVAIAGAMWVIFFLGDMISSLLFDFARSQVDGIYGLGDGNSKVLLALQLLLLTGPAEEIFWRGYIQKNLSAGMGAGKGMAVTLILYTAIHLWSFNFMLIMAAFVAGAVWGMLYRWKPSLLPALVISHAVWDMAVFVLFPIG